MKIQFDSNQFYQLEAIQSVVDLFEGQPSSDALSQINLDLNEHNLSMHELGYANKLVVDSSVVLDNLRIIQKRNSISLSESLEDFHFSIEMETGTGKTYVYLRTIFALNQKYGFSKFIIVVPSIAIKEGVIKNLEITKDHFELLYKTKVDFFLYDPKKLSDIRSFCISNTLQILIINIDSFAKFDEEKVGLNIMYKDIDKLSGRMPIEFIQKTNPIVIIDEPQNMETENRRTAINNLNPLFTLRYSATHKNIYNLIYKLDPIKAYELGLVKRIEVDSVIKDNDYNSAYIELLEIKASKSQLKAKIKILFDEETKTAFKTFTIDTNREYNLHILSNEMESYKDNFILSEIHAGESYIEFLNGLRIYVGQTNGLLNDEVMKFQIRETLLEHFEKEKKLIKKGIKVLSLFFIDKVKNYKEPNGEKGKFAKWFEEIYTEFSTSPTYSDLAFPPVEKVHNGYFSQDKKGVFKDTNGETSADNDTYNLIMKKKEELLSISEPLKFIFSHSALREGWDNPNVFQICTLNETKSKMKKRQEIGRGLRLPVNQEGIRIFDKNLNVLTIVANESYEDFAKSLQKEYEEECGVNFKNNIKNKRDKVKVSYRKGYDLDENFLELWNRIKQRTRYNVSFSTEELISKAVAIAKSKPPIEELKILIKKGNVELTENEILTSVIKQRSFKIEEKISFLLPNVLEHIQKRNGLTKQTISEVIFKSNRLKDLSLNPQKFIDIISESIQEALEEFMISGIKYEKIAGSYYEMKLFESDELENYLDSLVKVKNEEKTIYNYINIDSDIETKFAKDLDSREDVKFFFKLPLWFKIDTPVGSYSPDWAIVFQWDKKIYFVAETKPNSELRNTEYQKIFCGEKHFDIIEDTYFKRVQALEELIQK